MKKNYTNLEMLIRGIQEIAMNHNLDCDTDWEDNGEVCIYGGCNAPTLQDVKFLCENIGIDDELIEDNECGIDVWISDTWLEEKAQEIYQPQHELWRKNQ